MSLTTLATNAPSLVEPKHCHVCTAPACYSEPDPCNRKRERHSCKDHPPAHVRRFNQLALAAMLRGQARRKKAKQGIKPKAA